MSKQATDYQLPEILDLMSAETLHEKFTFLLSEDKDIVLDCASVARITTPAVQVLMAFANDLQESGAKLSLANRNENIDEAFNLLGLKAFLVKWSE